MRRLKVDDDSFTIGSTLNKAEMFPRPDRETREAWIKFVQKNRNEETWLPSDHTLICSDHFKNEDKYITKTGRQYLKKCAVPYAVSDSKSAAYKYIRETYNKALPHPRTICRWYSKVDAEPGFTEEAFKVLKKKSQLNEKPVLCSLIFDEMAIRSQKLFNKERKLGTVNFGADSIEGEDEDTTATQALVFMLVSINDSCKLPVNYSQSLPIAGINAERKANLIKICLHKCHEVGVTVANLTFDGCATNLKAAEILGCQLTNLNNIKTHFPHPSTSEKVCIFLDPCHVIKLIRNTFERKRVIFDGNNGQIRWQLLINLNKLQQSEGLRFANKLTPRHISFRNQIMKVKLATQLLIYSLWFIRINQDHLELFFGLIRKHGGYNNNPNVLQLRAAHKKTLNHLELRSSFSGNCIPLDNFSILNSSSVNVINSTSSLNRQDGESYEVLELTRALESDIETEKNCEIFANMLNNENTTEASQLIVGYISEYVSRYLIKSLK
ncbi:unnamed protein product [Euphydryas editha]|uniref:THAP-type domain-containing protein n=1 Tax=Euphydryas editha TaxID=104508 RepID=A0AAU9VGD9_EUPED|nr:unnamed protein product [Euphydryas editha]